ncbi:hypothetical protein Slin15195_G077390 [Septoria linicola]|uniref:Uncharacterized protein n=1 Tax=Septoria linicola TaxID=215465 RepID=A0A9Q9EKU4_9PEZI|nr:hypothetical protein Slin14017_G038560 [Septoria linicola]USW54420.1 hypothetical protein Slin15195_G077390 [Septoria linicola]
MKIKEVFDPAEPVVSGNTSLPEERLEQDETQRKAMLDTRKSLNDSLLKTLGHLEEVATTQKELAEAQEKEMRELRSLYRAMRFNLRAEAGEDLAAQIVADLRAPPPEVGR